jgi:hypothetical protein
MQLTWKVAPRNDESSKGFEPEMCGQVEEKERIY